MVCVWSARPVVCMLLAGDRRVEQWTCGDWAVSGVMLTLYMRYSKLRRDFEHVTIKYGVCGSGEPIGSDCGTL